MYRSAFSGMYERFNIFQYLVEETKGRGYDAALMSGTINYNPLGVLTTSGNWIESSAKDFETAKQLIVAAKDKLPAYRVLAANGCIFREAGASIRSGISLHIGCSC